MSASFNIDVDIDPEVMQEFVEDMDDSLMKIESLINDLCDYDFDLSTIQSINKIYQDISLNSTKITLNVISEALNNIIDICNVFSKYEVFSKKIAELLLLINDRLLKIAEVSLSTSQINLMETQNIMVILQTIFEAKNKEQCLEKVENALISISQTFESGQAEENIGSDELFDDLFEDFTDFSDLSEENNQALIAEPQAELIAEQKKSVEIIIADKASNILSMTDEYISFLLKDKVFHLLSGIADKGDYTEDSHVCLLLRMGLAVNFLSGEKIDPEHYAKAICLHDIALLTIEDIINKPEKLTPEEFERVRQHPVDGALLAQQLNFHEQSMDIIRHHHERINGTGYPDGIKGDEISDGAKITAIIDSFYAMVHERPHKKYSRSVFRAVSELNACVDSEYDKFWIEQFNRFIKEIWLPSQKQKKAITDK